jgi:uncharacterized protein YndB with AHSA1/START domain
MTTANEVGVLTVTTPSDREVLIRRTVAAPRRLVFAAWTRPEHLSRWLLGPEGWTMPICEIDLRPGGSWHYGWRRADGSELDMYGEYREVSPPERLVFTERWGGDWPETLHTLVLTEEDGRTTMSEWVRYPSREARDAALATGMTDGLTASYERLDAVLRGLA